MRTPSALQCARRAALAEKVRQAVQEYGTEQLEEEVQFCLAFIAEILKGPDPTAPASPGDQGPPPPPGKSNRWAKGGSKPSPGSYVSPESEEPSEEPPEPRVVYNPPPPPALPTDVPGASSGGGNPGIPPAAPAQIHKPYSQFALGGKANPADFRAPCDFCGEEHPQHPGRFCAKNPNRVRSSEFGGIQQQPGPRATGGSNPPRFYAIWAGPEAAGPWFGYWGRIRNIYDGSIAGKRAANEAQARQFLIDHGDYVASQRAVREAL